MKSLLEFRLGPKPAQTEIGWSSSYLPSSYPRFSASPLLPPCLLNGSFEVHSPGVQDPEVFDYGTGTDLCVRQVWEAFRANSGLEPTYVSRKRGHLPLMASRPI